MSRLVNTKHWVDYNTLKIKRIAGERHPTIQCTHLPTRESNYGVFADWYGDNNYYIPNDWSPLQIGHTSKNRIIRGNTWHPQKSIFHIESALTRILHTDWFRSYQLASMISIPLIVDIPRRKLMSRSSYTWKTENSCWSEPAMSIFSNCSESK